MGRHKEEYEELRRQFIKMLDDEEFTQFGIVLPKTRQMATIETILKYIEWRFERENSYGNSRSNETKHKDNADKAIGNASITV